MVPVDCARVVVEDDVEDEESTTDMGDGWGNDNVGPLVAGGLEFIAAVGLLLPEDALPVDGIGAECTLAPILQELG